MESPTAASDRHARVKRLFLAALERPEAERAGWLEGQTDDSAIRREVLELLAWSPPADGGRTVWVGSDREPTEPTAPFEGAGRTIAGRYRILERIGEGGMADVYKARDLVLDQLVALKRVRGGRRLVRNEVRLARQITHPNVCRVFDVGEDEDSVFLTMELVDGEDLGSLLRKVGRLPQDRVLEIAVQLCAGLASAHARGILHRDLKPGNVLVDRSGRVKITDFGIATAEGSEPTLVAGTPAWMAPELLRGDGATERSDLYALGLVLYRLLTGRRPERVRARSEAPSPSERVTGVDPEVEEAILGALRPDPAERPASVLAFAATLPGCDVLSLALESGLTPPAEVVERSTDPRRSGSTRATLGWLAVGLASLAAAVVAADRWSGLADSGLGRPPAYLAEKTGDLLRGLGHPPPADREWGFLPDLHPDFRDAPILFWYRESPVAMAPRDAENLFWGGARVDPFDPPLDERGMVLAFTDPEGRLLELEAVAPDDALDRDPPGGFPTAPPSAGAGADPPWDALLAATGVGEPRPAEPLWTPRVWGDRRRAWIGDDPRRPGREIRMEGAAAGDRVVWVRTEPEDAAEPELPPAGRWSLAMGIEHLLLIVPLLLCAVPARRHLARGRADADGALRLSVAIIVGRMLHWILTASHVPGIREETLMLLAAFAVVVLEAATVGVGYLALEPMVRRDLPQALVAWRRALSGRWRDPLVARHVQVGTAAGGLLATLASLDTGLSARLAAVSWAPTDLLLWTALRPAHLPANVLEQALGGVTSAFVALLTLVALRRLLGRGPAPVVVFLLVASLYYSLEGDHPLASWALLGTGLAAGSAFLLIRYGLLALAVAFWVDLTLSSAPLALGAGTWYAGTGQATVVLFVVLLAAASLAAGKPVDGSPRDGRRRSPRPHPD